MRIFLFFIFISLSYSYAVVFPAGDGTGKAEIITQEYNSDLEIKSGGSIEHKWKVWRNEWLNRKKIMVNSLNGLSPFEQDKKHMAWLLYQAPDNNVVFEYLRYEDLFRLAGRINDWNAASLYLDKMNDYAIDIPGGIDLMIQWITQYNNIPNGVFDRTASISNFSKRLETNKNWKALSEFYSNKDNPKYNLSLSKTYLEKSIEALDPFSQFKTITEWQIRNKIDFVEQYNLVLQNEELLDIWWASKFQAFCQSNGGYAKVKKNGTIENTNCLKN